MNESIIASVTEAVFGDVPIRNGFSEQHQAAYVVAADLRKAVRYTGSTNTFLSGLEKGGNISSPLRKDAGHSKGEGFSLTLREDAGRGKEVQPLNPLYTGIEVIQTSGGPQRMKVIYKRGVFQLLMLSQLPAATAYRDRIFDLLESVERDGFYISPEITPAQTARLSEYVQYKTLRDAIAGSLDYDTQDPSVRKVFSGVQDLFHRAVTGMSAQQLCTSGREIVTWTGKRGPTKKDRETGKNYLTQRELTVYTHLGAYVLSRVKLTWPEGGHLLRDVQDIVQEALTYARSVGAIVS